MDVIFTFILDYMTPTFAGNCADNRMKVECPTAILAYMAARDKLVLSIVCIAACAESPGRRGQKMI
jgi:hypothetical protein